MRKVKNNHHELLKSIGDHIRMARKAKKWSQYELATRSDINRTYLGYVENGKFNVSIQKLCDIANALEIDIRDLFFTSEIGKK